MRSALAVAVLALLAFAPAQSLATVAVDIGFDPTQACPGDPMRFFASIENTGSQAELVGLTVTITFGGETYGPFQSHLRLAAGETISREVAFMIPRQTPAGTLTVTVVATDSSGSVEASASLEVLSCGQTGNQGKQLPDRLSKELRREGLIE